MSPNPRIERTGLGLVAIRERHCAGRSCARRSADTAL